MERVILSLQYRITMAFAGKAKNLTENTLARMCEKNVPGGGGGGAPVKLYFGH